MRASIRLLLCTTFLGGFGGCGGQPPGASEEPSGSLSAAIEFGAGTHDVTAVRFDVVAADGNCDSTPIASHTVSLEEEPAPGTVEGGQPVSHHFANSLF